MNVPDPVPSAVFVPSAVVGPGVVLQQTPRTVIAAPPSLVIFPPPEAEVSPIEVIDAVVSTGKVGTGKGSESFEQPESTDGRITRAVPPCITF